MMTAPHPSTVAAGSAVRMRYFDHEGTPRIAVILSTVPTTEVRERAEEIRTAVEAYASALGGIVIDISVDLEDREPIVQMGVQDCPPIRGAGFLQLATVHGKSVSGRTTTSVDLILSEDDSTWEPTNLAELTGSTYG
jgi:hypothetical protein